ncbi:MAG: hypothetical protein ACOYMB_00495 [Patescibacteria group bacterium]
MKKIILIILGSFLLLVFAAAFYYGLFSSENIVEKSVGGETLIYQERIGDYNKSNLTMDVVSAELKNNFGIECSIGFGVYYDNPQQVTTEKLRSEVGCILPKEASERLDEIQASSVVKVRRNPVVKSVISEFPYRNKISYVLGVLKIYPLLTKYLKEHNYQPAPSMEIYDLNNHNIEYRMVVVEN